MFIIEGTTFTNKAVKNITVFSTDGLQTCSEPLYEE